MAWVFAMLQYAHANGQDLKAAAHSSQAKSQQKIELYDAGEIADIEHVDFIKQIHQALVVSNDNIEPRSRRLSSSSKR